MSTEGHFCWEDCDEGPHGCVCGNDCAPPSERLALAFVECTTEFDYEPLPHEVKVKLIDAATALLVHSDPVLVTLSESTTRKAIE